MRHSTATLMVIAALAATMSSPAFARGTGKHGSHAHHAHHGHHGHRGGARVGVFVGAPLLAAPFYYPPYYPSSRYYYDYAPPPPVYIQQSPVQPHLYFCPALNAYYPQVRQCPGGWQAVLPPA